MSQKCVHKGCGKTFTNAEEECLYHPGPPIFHEGQKGWKCCKPRVLTFDEFLTIPPCTTGKHSAVDDTPLPEKKDEGETAAAPIPKIKPVSTTASGTTVPSRVPQAPQPSAPTPIPPEPESDSDDPSLSILPNTTCRRRGCNATSPRDISSREGEACVYHPGNPLFHEGSKGWTCCKRRVLEFDEFMRIEGCKRKGKHLFVGSGKKGRKGDEEEKLDMVRHDFYQTASTIHASFYLKSISSSLSTISYPSSPSPESHHQTLSLDLRTTGFKKSRYTADIPLFGPIDPKASTYKIMNTKIEFSLTKADGASWPVLRGDERRIGEIIQVGRAGRA